ncbi:hypothetical protein AGMMS49983_22000 [Clostridia bacterium]|nr:hypothetical protein AGMMS49983_22000 [Clostridia bacterium]
MNTNKKLTLNINGTDRLFVCDLESDTLATVLRRLGFTGTKVGCATGVCGACTVVMDGAAIHACTRRIASVKEGTHILTIEGIGTPENPHPLQIAFLTNNAFRCGFCTPGFIVSAYALLGKNPSPSREDVQQWFLKHRNLCRCTEYKPIVDAVMEAAEILRGERSVPEIPADAVNGLAKVCGEYDFVCDVALDMPAETLHVALVQPKVTHHARVVKINKDASERSDGVFKIVLLDKKEITNYGDVVALVCADTKLHAREAAAKATVVLETLPERFCPVSEPSRLSIEGGSALAYLDENGEIAVSFTPGAGSDQLAEFVRTACQATGGRPVSLSPSYSEYLALNGIPQNNPLAAGIPTIAQL